MASVTDKYGTWDVLSTGGLAAVNNVPLHIGDELQFVYKDIDFRLIPAGITEVAILAAVDIRQTVLPGQAAIRDRYITNRLNGKFDLVIQVVITGGQQPEGGSLQKASGLIMLSLATVAIAVSGMGVLYLIRENLKEVRKLTSVGITAGDTTYSISLAGFISLAVAVILAVVYVPKLFKKQRGGAA